MDWLTNLYGKTFVFGDLLTIVGMIGAIIAAIVSWIKSKKSKENAAEAKKFSENAEAANASAKRYYDLMVIELEQRKHQAQEQEHKNSTKSKVLKMFDAETMMSTSKIAENLQSTTDKVKPLLHEMYSQDHSIADVKVDTVTIHDDFCHWRRV